MPQLIRIFCFTLSIIGFASFADVLKLKADAPANYVVKKGDTLWDISAIYLNSPWNWPKLWGNNLQIKDPHWIYPGDVLSLVFDVEGNPRLVVNQNKNKKQVKLSPEKRIVHKNLSAIATLPLNTIKPYLTNHRLVSVGEYNNAAILLGGDNKNKIKIEGDLLYSQGQLIANELYGIYRLSANKSLLAGHDEILEVELTGMARVIHSENSMSRLKLLNNLKEVLQGDILLPLSDDKALPVLFHLSAPKQNVDAKIIASASEFREFSKLEVVVINAGVNQLLETGNVLGIFRQSPSIAVKNGQPVYYEDAGYFTQLFSKEQTMPLEKVGDLVVFKVYQDASYALITDANRPLKIGDLVAQPE
ncbi:LysM peptidoglycan-binding domain-containing protein [Catenovulum sp. 2E275]|uniref:LysM peptidoglycan-binding domain-containing protein n=1 Tax=Catenovulum sp. 2E275 TaxID=2980497 RepID=UPI0021D2E1BC|nr:LysM peptidoglycan-binding domain-containing protein [Catenovulum sp. 2E275]MCU4675878.1 LysM peptidoglycan-binding domain-containing protein [Catenovulum sp. 2E275]